MVANSGLQCKRCGHKCEKPKSKTVKGDKLEVCPVCDWPDTLERWELPLNERIGRCGNCGNASFTSSMGKNKTKGQLLRKCKTCGEVLNTDTNKVARKGDKKHEYKPNKCI